MKASFFILIDCHFLQNQGSRDFEEEGQNFCRISQLLRRPDLLNAEDGTGLRVTDNSCKGFT